MIPLGYMLKKVVTSPEWMKAPNVSAVYSVSNCVSSDFADYISLWKHNGWWFFNSPKAVFEAAKEKSVDTKDMMLFYYEAFESDYDEDDKTWSPIAPEKSFETAVEVPTHKTLRGFDVVTYSVTAGPECSPLSCNAVASEVATNQYCLLDGLEEAQKLLERGVFDNSEPGPFRIIAVYTPEQRAS